MSTGKKVTRIRPKERKARRRVVGGKRAGNKRDSDPATRAGRLIATGGWRLSKGRKVEQVTMGGEVEAARGDVHIHTKKLFRWGWGA